MNRTGTAPTDHKREQRTELPTPLYAAAGAGELAYQRLRRLPEATARTLRTAGQTATTLRERLATGERDLGAELAQMRSQVRESARRGADAVAARAATAQERAVTGYRSLVARGERVVSERFGVATGQAGSPTRVEVVVGEPEPAPAVTAPPPTATTTPPATTPPATTPPAATPPAATPPLAGTTPPAATPAAGTAATGRTTRGAAKAPGAGKTPGAGRTPGAGTVPGAGKPATTDETPGTAGATAPDEGPAA